MIPDLGKRLQNVTVTITGHCYRRKIGSMFDPSNMERMMKLQTQGKLTADPRESVFVSRLLIERVDGKLMPDLRFVSRCFFSLKSRADFETKDMMQLNRNNFGNLLLDLPERPRNIVVAREFLNWLDKEIV